MYYMYDENNYTNHFTLQIIFYTPIKDELLHEMYYAT